MTEALADGGISPSEVDYLNAHGTSTVAGDLAEMRGPPCVCRQDAVHFVDEIDGRPCDRRFGCA